MTVSSIRLPRSQVLFIEDVWHVLVNWKTQEFPEALRTTTEYAVSLRFTVYGRIFALASVGHCRVTRSDHTLTSFNELALRQDWCICL